MSENDPALEDGPIEIADAIPASITSFAQELVDRRTLAASLEVPHIPAESSANQLQQDTAFTQFSDVPGYEDWLAWVAHWTSRFSGVSEAAAVSLRMSHSRHATCPKFHMDAVRLRLIATLLGPGTEWLRSENVTRAGDGSIGQSPDPASVQQMAPGSVGIFKGSSFDPVSRRGVVHRSPQERVDRVVMTLDIAA